MEGVLLSTLLKALGPILGPFMAIIVIFGVMLGGFWLRWEIATRKRGLNKTDAKKAVAKINEIHSILIDAEKRIEYSKSVQKFDDASESIKKIEQHSSRIHRLTHLLEKTDFHEKFEEVYKETLSLAAKVRSIQSNVCAKDDEGRPRIWFPKKFVSVIENLEIVLNEVLHEAKTRKTPH